MKTLPEPGIRTLLALSLSLNMAVAGVGAVHVVQRGGVPYLKAKLGWGPHPFEARPFQVDRLNVFRSIPDGPAEIVLAGESYATATPMVDFFTPFRNRGIGGNTTAGLLARLDEITGRQPERVFLQVGPNDVANLIPASEWADNYGKILEQIRLESPRTRVFVLSVPKTCPPKDPSMAGRNPMIRELNEKLRTLAPAEGAAFTDLGATLDDDNGDLRKEFAHVDGLHLSSAGHFAVCKVLRAYIPTLTNPNAGGQ